MEDGPSAALLHQGQSQRAVATSDPTPGLYP